MFKSIRTASYALICVLISVLIPFSALAQNAQPTPLESCAEQLVSEVRSDLFSKDESLKESVYVVFFMRDVHDITGLYQKNASVVDDFSKRFIQVERPYVQHACLNNQKGEANPHYNGLMTLLNEFSIIMTRQKDLLYEDFKSINVALTDSQSKFFEHVDKKKFNRLYDELVRKDHPDAEKFFGALRKVQRTTLTYQAFVLNDASESELDVLQSAQSQSFDTAVSVIKELLQQYNI